MIADPGTTRKEKFQAEGTYHNREESIKCLTPSQSCVKKLKIATDLVGLQPILTNP